MPFISRNTAKGSVADPDPFDRDADPDPSDVVPDPIPDPAFHFDTDRDPAFSVYLLVTSRVVSRAPE